MPISRCYQEFVDFIAEYTAFLGQMCLDEKEKLSALASKELAKIEHSISVSQANAKRLENFEAKRQVMQRDAGLEGQTFRQVIDGAPQEAREDLLRMFTQFERNVSEIRFYNDKSMGVAKDSMIEINPDMVLHSPAAQRTGGPTNPYEKIQEERRQERTSMLETKV